VTAGDNAHYPDGTDVVAVINDATQRVPGTPKDVPQGVNPARIRSIPAR